MNINRFFTQLIDFSHQLEHILGHIYRNKVLILTLPEWVSKDLKSNLRMVDLPAGVSNSDKNKIQRRCKENLSKGNLMTEK